MYLDSSYDQLKNMTKCFLTFYQKSNPLKPIGWIINNYDFKHLPAICSAVRDSCKGNKNILKNILL